jgi:hypothetical protein
MKLAVFYDLKFTKVYINLENMSFIGLTLCKICLFEFIRVEGGVKFVKHFKWGASYKSLETSVLRVDGTMFLKWAVFNLFRIGFRGARLWRR